MQSNITVKSNISIRTNANIMLDTEFASHITGSARLRQIHSRADGSSRIHLSQWQEAIRSGSIRCAYARNGEQTHGLICKGEQIICVCRCENTQCRYYETCMSDPDSMRILRKPAMQFQAEEPLPVLPISAVYQILHTEITEGEAVYENDRLLEREMQSEHRTAEEEPQFSENAADYAASDFTVITSPEPIISASLHTYILLNSGPGTGKTYTIIQRLFHLLSERLCEPESIVVLCYTRAARDVITERIYEKVQNGALPPNAGDVCVLTFDSYAAYYLREFEDELPDYSSLGYNERIALFTQHITAEDLSTIRYLIVDEMQDLVNERAKMVLKLLSCISCGYLLAGDRCQAIYDYEADGERTMDSVAFYKALDALLPPNTARYEITGNHRQTDALAKQSDAIRQVLLHDDIRKQNQFTGQFMLQLTKNCDTVENWAKQYTTPDNGSTALLCRNNGEAAYLDTLLCKREIPHESFHGNCGSKRLARWLADVFWDYALETIGQRNFIERCRCRLGTKDETAETYWRLLSELTGREHTDLLQMQDIRRALKDPESLPAMLLSDNSASLCVSTIHKAKGKEFDHVYLLYSELPPKSNSAEESRTRYVAVTRAKQDLHMLRKKTNSNWFFRKTNSGRWLQTQRQYIYKKTAFCRSISFGFSQECIPAGFAAGEPERAVAVQQYISKNLRRYDRLTARLNADKSAYLLYHNNTMLGVLAQEMTADIRSCVQCTDYKYNLPSLLKDIYISDVYTVLDSAIHPDMIDCMQSSQMWLGISLTGFARAEYEKKERNHA